MINKNKPKIMKLLHCNFIENNGLRFNESVKQKNINILNSFNEFTKRKRMIENC